MEEVGYRVGTVLYANPAMSVEVFEAVELKTGRTVVLKRFRTQDLCKVNEILHEAMTQKCLDHPNICKVHRVGMWSQGVFIVLEKLEKDLAMVLQEQAAKGSQFNERYVWNVLQQSVTGLAFAQEKGYSHRDVKPQNILLGADGTLKICDFGTAKELLGTTETHTFTGTPLYLCPLLRQEFVWRTQTSEERKVRYAPHKSDVYSLGLTMVYVCTLEPPRTLARVPGLPEITQNLIMAIPYSDILKQVLLWMLQVQEEQRPDFVTLRDYLNTLLNTARNSPASPANEPQSQLSRPKNITQTIDYSVNGQSPESPNSRAIKEEESKQQPTTSDLMERFKNRLPPRKVEISQGCAECGQPISGAYYQTTCGHCCCSQECHRRLISGRHCRICSPATGSP